MQTPPIPSFEQARLANLKRYQVLDTDAEQVFDDLTFLAKNITGCDIALISLVDETRQWFKSKQGLDACETSRDISFCGHVVAQDKAITVTNATQDPRFADNPLVTGGPRIRFYHGVPLYTPSGYSIGTLCVIHPEPRFLTEAQLAAVAALARQVVQNLELRYKSLRMEELAQQANRAYEEKSRYLATISHDIRTPIGGILGLTDIMLDDTAISEDTRCNLETVRDSAGFLLRMLEDLLELSKIEANQITLERMDLCPCSLMNHLITFYRPKALEKGLTLTGHCDADVPPLVFGDPHRLEQVLINLISNAVKFTHEGGVSVQLSSNPGQDNQACVTFTVRDTGIGISEAQARHIFASFRQADASTARRYGGYGLGLHIAKQLVTLMGGTLSLSPNPEGGSIFSFTLPFEKNHDQPREPERSPAGETTTERRVLVVEDEPMNQKVFSLQVEHLGHQVQCAGDGKTALALFAEQGFDCVLVDLNLPDQGGFAVARRIRELAPGNAVPIYGVTACIKPGDEERGREAGMHRILLKPIDMDTLTSILGERG